MNRIHILRSVAIALLLGFTLGAAVQVHADEPQLAHMVFFTLKDRTPEAKKQLIASCRKHLSKHEGTVYFSVGSVATDLDRPVNDRDFDVALHVVFANKAAHDTYQRHPRHLKFIEENRDAWAKVRVFDSYVTEDESR